MLTNVAAGVAPVIAGALVQPLASAPTSVVATPFELKKLVLDNVVAPFVEAGSKNLGDAVSAALLRWAGLTPSPSATPSKETVAQIQAALQKKLKAELSSRPEFRAAARKARLTPDQLAAELANAIAKGLATSLADALVRVPSSPRLNDRFVITITAGVTQLQLSRLRPQPRSHSYAVQPGDSLWRISQRLLGPTATAHEIDAEWRVIYRDNRASIGADPNRIVPGQILHIPRTPEAAPSLGWARRWLVLVPAPLIGIAARRRKTAKPARPGGMHPPPGQDVWGRFAIDDLLRRTHHRC